MSNPSTARLWHLLTAVFAISALALQFGLVLAGHRPLLETAPPAKHVSIIRFFSYFTVLSNLLVAISTSWLALGKTVDSRLARVVRIDATVGIAVTAVVHWFLLRPLLNLNGLDLVADKLLHVVVPVLALLGWAVFGPRGAVHRSDLVASAIYPAAYMVWTLIHGAATDWYPYPFTDVGVHGYPVVLINACGVIVLLAAGAVAMSILDERLPGVQLSSAGSNSASR